jgi:serine/threonine protein kinase
MIEKDSNCTVYRNVVKADNRKEIFQTRMENVLKVRSYHMLPVEKGRLYDYPVVYYKETCEETLQTLIDRGVELLATELKNITWQIAKLMLSCEEFKVNHLRLHPKSIGLQRKYDPERPLFLQVKDFSMGKEFSQVSEGKHLEYFEYQHPDLSISNQMIDFDVYQPRYDIWSLGIILYHLIYRQSPFCKPGNNIFSKTILNKYCAYDY